MKAPTLFEVSSLIELTSQNLICFDGKTWVPARPLGMATLWSRFVLAWKVFTGELDAVKWPYGQ